MVTVVSVAVETAKFLFGISDCTVNNDVGTGDFSLVLGILHACGHAHVRSHVSPGMDWLYHTFSCCKYDLLSGQQKGSR